MKSYVMTGHLWINFQEGPVKEVGVNPPQAGQAQDMIEVLVGHPRELNVKLPCRETSVAITRLEEARLWLDERTRRRTEPGVEGIMEAHW